MQLKALLAAAMAAAASACGTIGTEPLADAGTPSNADAGASLYPHPTGWTTAGSASFHGATAVKGLGGCTPCHGTDLTGGTARVSCEQCHGGWKTNCTFCHGGTDNSSGAPPRDVAGRTDTAEVTVGAHRSHVSAPHKLSKQLGCGECHPLPVPADALASGHVRPGPAPVTAAGWNRSAATCSVYCHGSFPGGNETNAPTWTQVGQGQALCGACHGVPPADGPSRPGKSHHSWEACSACHGSGYSTSQVNAATHVNKSVEVIANVGWNASAKTCAAPCHNGQNRPWR